MIIIKVIESSKAPKAIGPYSQAIETNNLIFISGQLPIDVNTGEFAGSDISVQTRQSLENAKHILNEAGSDMSKVVKTTVLLSDINNFAAMNDVYSEYFTSPYPARAAYEVANLPKGALVEIELIAEK